MEGRLKLIQKLKDYFEKREDIVMAFLFGSQAKGNARRVSDWDIGIYFKPTSRNGIELELERDYPESHIIWGDMERIVGASVDLVVLNRAASPLVFLVISKGLPLAMKNRTIYLRLLLKTHYEAIDFWQFTEDFWRIRERSASLSPADRSDLIKHTVGREYRNGFA